ncbi:MAG TPA: TlpA disulfide reductase family protein [Candidatus Acidoferrum sp.]|nr:TlpA disulfide reductase family protein [Candidatus Acidoferrum sp.]
MRGKRLGTCRSQNWSAVILALVAALIAVSFSGCGGGAQQNLVTSDVSVSFNDPNGNNISLKLPCTNNCPAELKGKVVLVNFWATWCEACKAEIPSLIDFQQKYANKGFTFLGIAMDDDGAKVVQPFVMKTKFDVNGDRMNMNYPIVLGNDSVADKFGGLWAYPTSILLTRDGKIVKRFIGALSQEDLQYIHGIIGS